MSNERVAVWTGPGVIGIRPRPGGDSRLNLRDHRLGLRAAVFNKQTGFRPVPVAIRCIAVTPYVFAAPPAYNLVAVVFRFTRALKDDPRMDGHHAFPAPRRRGINLNNLQLSILPGIGRHA